jgi:hypothetical protein
MTQVFRFFGLSGSPRGASNSTAVLGGIRDALRFALAGVDDLLNEIRAVRFCQSAAGAS